MRGVRRRSRGYWRRSRRKYCKTPFCRVAGRRVEERVMKVKIGKALASAAMCCFVFQSCAITAGGAAEPGAIPQSNDFYFAQGEAELQRKLAQAPILGEAKNIILFIGDGMSIPTIAAARIYAGQKRGLDGVSYKLAMEQLPYSALSRTYSHDFQVTDSAPSAVAMTTGVKTLNTVLGVNKNVVVGDCASAAGVGYACTLSSRC